MKQLATNLRKGEIKVKIENLDDLWYLSQIIDPGDIVRGKTIRKIKIGDKEQRQQKISKKAIFMAIEVEKIEFSKTSDSLRVSGKIVEAPEDIPKGDYHTFNLEENSTVTIVKEKWLKFQLDKLKEASSKQPPKIIICVHDREEAYFAKMKKFGYEMLTTIKGDVQKKAVEEKTKEQFYTDVIKKLEEYDKRYDLDKIIIASPAFFKEDLMKQMNDDELKKKVILATCSAVGENGVDEVMKRDEVRVALQEQRAAEEVSLVEGLLTEISKEGMAAYGTKDAEDAANAGAVKVLLVTDSLIRQTREKGTYEQIDSIMKVVDSTKGDIKIISSEHEGGKKLDGLGGIGAILRYKLSY